MSSAQPATPTNIPDVPLKLTADQLAGLIDRLKEWLSGIIPEGTELDDVELSKESAYEVQEAVKHFLNGIKFRASLSEAQIRHLPL